MLLAAGEGMKLAQGPEKVQVLGGKERRISNLKFEISKKAKARLL